MDLTDIELYFLLAAIGAIGGLLFGIRDRRLELPRYIKAQREDDSQKGGYIQLGVIADLIFGIAGGYVIFLILPSIPDTNDLWGLIKIVALSLIGGYSGRAVVEKVASDQLKQTEEKVSVLERKLTKSEERDANSENALRVLYQVINHKRDFELKEIVEAFHNVPGNILVHGFGMAEAARTQITGELLAHEKSSKPEIDKIKEGLLFFVPLIQAIITVEEDSQKPINRKYIHFHYASLAYLYKDIAEPRWDKAFEYIKKAINSFKTANDEVSLLPIYNLNLLLCHINLIPLMKEGVFDTNCTSQGKQHHEQALAVFNGLLEGKGEGIEMIATSKEVLAPNLHGWVSMYKSHEMKKYIKTHTKLPAPDINLWTEHFKQSENLRGSK